ncbi:fatty acid desaturase family protein [Chitinophaga sp. GCM10012297]|uniref:Fatty acid desaturase n=1 Tax=Chitinophaga chungangae TaxID=2821488 RepID=A0ABS3YA99_9BACT|nr:fatty acid desaturase [Chitinophaga chungangae]MBO9151602.1 fatty acid desaturase [Chitinophaga chungangae]
MLEGKQLILATKPYAQEKRALSWWYTASTLVLLVASLTATVAVPFLPLQIMFSVLSGLLIVRMFVIYHDYQHHSILKNSAVAEAIMTVFGIYILAPSSIWKRSHDYHHQHNSKLYSASIGSYPVATVKKFGAMSRRERIMYLFTRHPLTILFGYLFMFIIGMCVNSFFVSPRRHYDALIALLVHAAASVAVIVFAGWAAWALLILIPIFIACAIGTYLFYAQHNFPGVIFNTKEDWCYDEAALLSSSHMVMSPLMAWFTGNIGLHHIHHLNARIPFYRLPEAMNNIPELQAATTTSLRWKDIRACLKLKVWDPELQRMTGTESIRRKEVRLNGVRRLLYWVKAL